MHLRCMLLAIACGCSPERTEPAATGAPAPAPEPPAPNPAAELTPEHPSPTTHAPADRQAAPPTVSTTPNQFLTRGTPTFVVGTSGDAASDRANRGQAKMIADLFFAGAAIVDDASFDASAGEAAWPSQPVLYGSPHVHGSLAAVTSGLPFRMDEDRLMLGGRTFEGEGIRLVTVVPARSSPPARPELLLYAGTGNDGVAEINALAKGNDVIVVGDVFGVVATGRWQVTAEGEIEAVMEPSARRIEWRSDTRPLPGLGGGGSARVEFRFPASMAAAEDDEAVIAASLRGLRRAIERLALDAPSSMTVYVYPDAGSKRALTGNGGDGHAVPAARALHVRRADSSEDGGLESLVAHEATHVLVRAPWGPSGSALFGEGVAVWVSGRYQGRSLAEWRGAIVRRPISELLGKGFFAAPEPETYPFAGLLVEAAIAEVGLQRVGEHLYGATAPGWDDACKAAGTTPDALEAALDRTLGAAD